MLAGVEHRIMIKAHVNAKIALYALAEMVADVGARQ